MNRNRAFLKNLGKGVIVTVEASKNVGGELGVTERLTNGSKGVSQHLDLVVESGHSPILLASFAKFHADSHGLSRRLRREARLQDVPHLM
jgi:hypothetical protein